MSRSLSFSLVCTAVLATGCASARQLPVNLPALPPPPKAPSAAVIPVPVDNELLLTDMSGTPLDGTIPVDQPFKVRLSYKWPGGKPSKDPVFVNLLWPTRKGNWAMAYRATSKPEPKGDKWVVEVEMESPPKPNRCRVAASVRQQQFIDTLLEVK